MINEQIPEILESVAKVAGEVVSFALLNEITIESVDLDVLGGAAIYLSNSNNDKELWISLLNNGSQTILDLVECETISSTLDYGVIMDYLFSD